jgi:shikimate dehydrogenase
VRTPQVFNAAFLARGHDLVAVSIDVAPQDLHSLVGGLRAWRNLAGIGVTMPHKKSILAEADDVLGSARHIGAVNNLRREPDGRLIAVNTDGIGFLIGLRNADREPAGRHSLVVGAGGAGHALAFALAEAGVARLTIANRTAERADRLAAKVASVFPDLPVHAGPADPAGHDLVVNATSLGMHDSDPLPIDVERLEPGTLVAEVVMAPPKTRLLREAERRGCVIHPGSAMLDGQVEAVLSFLGVGSVRTDSVIAPA